jgi:hypothetical protein
MAESLPEAEAGFIEGTDHALIMQKPAEVAQDMSAFILRHSTGEE